MYQKQFDPQGQLVSVKRLSDGAFIPFAPGNRDYQEYLNWVELGNTPEDDPQYSTSGIKDKKWEILKTERDRRKAGGVTVSGKWYHSDDSSRIQQLGLVMMGANIPANLQWKTMDGSFVTMTQTLASQIFTAVATLDQTLFAVAETKRAELYAAEDPSTVDMNVTWPASYQ